MSSTIFQNEKTPFKAKKNKKFERSENCYFSKGVNPLFWSNNGHFFNFFFLRQYRPKKCVLRYSRWKKHLSRLKKQEVQKVEKLPFCLKWLTHGFWTKTAICAIFFFVGNTCQENVVYDILEQKKAPFQAKKTKSSKSRKNCHFAKGVKPWFLENNGHFCNFFFVGNTGHENVFYDILEQNELLCRPKKQKVQKVEKLPFFQKG